MQLMHTLMKADGHMPIPLLLPTLADQTASHTALEVNV